MSIPNFKATSGRAILDAPTLGTAADHSNAKMPRREEVPPWISTFLVLNEVPDP